MQELSDLEQSERNMEENSETKIAFEDLNLDERLIKAAKEAGFYYCTPIQAETLPLLLSGLDVAGQAQTGTGKTAAYLLALLNCLITNETIDRNTPRSSVSSPRGLVLAPTRELAIQIFNDVKQLGVYVDLKVGLVYGGIDYELQRRQVSEGIDILIGTPGRIIDFFKQGLFTFKKVEVLVLDEADRMFDLGFIKDLRYLLRRIPHPTKRLGMLFSATLSFRVNELAYEFMNNPRTVKINPKQRTAEKVEQELYHVASTEKIALLIGILRQLGKVRAIVFVNTKKMGSVVARYLNANECPASTLSGDVEQAKRQRLIEDFKKGKINVVVATDVAARGLHIPGVELIVNYDLPQNSEDYVHRIGRTARAGENGSAISFACEEYVFSLSEIEDFIGTKIPVSSVNEGLLKKLNEPPKRVIPSGNKKNKKPSSKKRVKRYTGNKKAD